MAKKEFLLRYSYEIKRLKQGHASLKEIGEYLKIQSEFTDDVISFSKRTFQRDIKDIRTLFNIDIQYNQKGKLISLTVLINQLLQTE